MPNRNPLIKSLLAAAPIVLLAACGSAPRSTADTNGAPLIYVSSSRTPSSIADCLEDRLSSVHEERNGNATELTVGSTSNASYFVTLTPAAQGAVVRVMHPDAGAYDPPEEELRFDVARCTI